MNNEETKKLTPSPIDTDLTDKEEVFLETSINRGIWIEATFNLIVILFFSSFINSIIIYNWPSDSWQNIIANGIAVGGFLILGFLLYVANEEYSNRHIRASHKLTRAEDIEMMHDAIGNHRMEYLSDVGSRPNSSSFLPFSFFSTSTKYAQEIVRKDRRNKVRLGGRR